MAGASEDRSIAAIVFATNGHDPGHVRAHLHALIDRLPDDAVVRLWRFICWWLTPQGRRLPQDPR